MTLSYKTRIQHDADVEKIRERFLELRESPHDPTMRQAQPSHMMRSSNLYRKWRQELGLDVLSHVIEIDPIQMKVIVEPQVSMDELSRLTLEKKCMVPVIPEFKGITVGGAINGTALESSSHLHGLFHDICLAYHILIGNGEIIRVSATEHPDLFHGISGSFGSLAILLLVELRLIRAASHIELTYHPCENIQRSLARIQDLHEQAHPPEFLEGIVFSKDQIVVIEGRWCQNDQLPLLNLSLPWSPWYYSHVRKACFEQAIKVEKITTFDYLFRHDCGAFWMAAYGLHWELLTRYYLEGRLGLSDLSYKTFGSLEFEKFSALKDPSFIQRFLLNWQLSSQKLYNMFHATKSRWFENRFIIQDYFIPLDHTETFVEFIMEKVGIFPLWLCPIKSTTHPQILAPHWGNGMYVDVGVYGMPKHTASLKTIHTELNQLMQHLDGRKMLYSFCGYTEEEFWSIYKKTPYLDLRQRYYASDVWPSIEEKVLNTFP